MWLPCLQAAADGLQHRVPAPPLSEDSQGPSPCSTVSGGEVLVCDAASPFPGGPLLLPLGGGGEAEDTQRMGSPQYPFTQAMSPANVGDKRKLFLPCFSFARGVPHGDACLGEGSLPSSRGCSPTSGGPLGEAAAALLRRRLAPGLGSQSPHRSMGGPPPVLGVDGDEGAPLSAFSASTEWAYNIEGLLARSVQGAPTGPHAQSPRSLLWPKQEQQQQQETEAAEDKIAVEEVKQEEPETEGPQERAPIHTPVSSTFTVTEETDLSGSSSDCLFSSFVAAAELQQQQQQWAPAEQQTCVAAAVPSPFLSPTAIAAGVTAVTAAEATAAAAALGQSGCCSGLPSHLALSASPSATASTEPPCLQQQQQQHQQLLLRHAKAPRRKDTPHAAAATGSAAAAAIYPKDAATDSLFQHPTPAFIDYCIRKHLPSNPNPDNLPGIQLERQQKRWCASVYFRGNQFKKRFSSGRWGALGAFYAAIEWRQVQCRKFQKLKTAGAPVVLGSSSNCSSSTCSTSTSSSSLPTDRVAPLSLGTVAASPIEGDRGGPFVQRQPHKAAAHEETLSGSPLTAPAVAAEQQQQQQQGETETRSPSPGDMALGGPRLRRKVARRRTWEQQEEVEVDELAADGGEAARPPLPSLSVSSSPIRPVSPVRGSAANRPRPSPRRGGGGGVLLTGPACKGSPLSFDETADLSCPPPGDEEVQWHEGFRLPFGTEGRNQLLRRLRQLYHSDVSYWARELEAHRITFSRVPFATVPQLWKIAYVMGCFGFALYLSRKYAGGAGARAAAQQQQQLAAAAAVAHQRNLHQQQQMAL